MNIKAGIAAIEEVAERGYQEFKAEIAKHREGLDDDLTAAINSASELPAPARAILAGLVTRMVDYFAKQPAIPGTYDLGGTVPSGAPVAPPVADAPAPPSGTPIGDAAAAAVAAGPVHDDAAPVT